MLDQLQSTEPEKKSISLWVQLTSFGLNPIEWRVQPLAQNKYFIQNRVDKEFCLLGVTKSKNPHEPKWQRIQLIHL